MTLALMIWAWALSGRLTAITPVVNAAGQVRVLVNPLSRVMIIASEVTAAENISVSDFPLRPISLTSCAINRSPKFTLLGQS